MFHKWERRLFVFQFWKPQESNWCFVLPIQDECGLTLVSHSLDSERGRSLPVITLGLTAKQIDASFVSQLVKNPSTMRKTWVRSLDWEDPLEKEMATHSSILAWRIPRAEEPGGL